MGFPIHLIDRAMQVYPFRETDRVTDRTVLTIGNFDGVHLGHQALIRKVVEEAHSGNCASAILTFDPHPQQVLKSRAVPVLTTLPLRLRLFEALGLDAAYIIPFTRELAAKSAEEFLREYLLDHFRVQRMIIGYDFAFGRNRDGTAQALEALSRRHGFDLEIFPAVVLGEDVVSSTRIREALSAADFALAERLLGRAYSVLAEVERGDRRGHELGFPTLNQPARDPLPIPFGVYASRAVVDGRAYDGVSNYGVRPSIGKRDPLLETHLFDFSGELYGQMIEVRPLAKLRGERKFPSLENLKAQIAEDCTQARAVLKGVR